MSAFIFEAQKKKISKGNKYPESVISQIAHIKSHEEETSQKEQ